MGDPETRAKRASSRKRNWIAKEMWEKTKSVKKVHLSEKDRDKQRKWRLKDDPEGDYDNLDDWLMKKETKDGEETELQEGIRRLPRYS